MQQLRHGVQRGSFKRWAGVASARSRFIHLEKRALSLLTNRSARVLLTALRVWRDKATRLTRRSQALKKLGKKLQRAHARAAMAQWRAGLVNSCPSSFSADCVNVLLFFFVS